MPSGLKASRDVYASLWSILALGLAQEGNRGVRPDYEAEDYPQKVTMVELGVDSDSDKDFWLL